MTTKTLLEGKNDIVYRATKVILIPENQIIDEEPVSLAEVSNLVSENCPYCMTRYDIYFDLIECESCPMSIAGNLCDSFESTWRIAQDKWSDADKKYKNELVELIKKYNESNGFLSI